MDTCRIANGAGFLGDSLAAPRRLLEHAPCDFLTLEYLAELTMSILAAQRRKNPQLGYASDFLTVLADILPLVRKPDAPRIVTNAGGVNVLACVRDAAKLLVAQQWGDCRIACATGDDLLHRLPNLFSQGWEFPHLDSGEPFPIPLRNAIVCANAYLGAQGIVHSLADDAHIVITGRVADASLTVGPAAHVFQWNENDFDRLAGGAVAGHVIECGAQATGGYSVDWRDVRYAEIGYPIAEIEASGESVITKPSGSGGAVTQRTVSEQLVYEIGDPRCYRTPDVNVDFTSLRLADAGPDRVRIQGARGASPDAEYKVSLAYAAGFAAAGQLLVFGRDCLDRARACAEIVRQRLRLSGFEPQRWHVELLGAGQGVPGSSLAESSPLCPPEVVLRIAVEDPRREAVERFARELAPLITSAPAGIAGYAAGLPTVHPVFAYWPCTLPRDQVQSATVVRPAQEWLEKCP